MHTPLTHTAAQKRITFFFVLLGIWALFFLATPSVHAATYTWDGGGGTENWGECANWSSDICPGSSDVALFNGTSTKDAEISANITVSGLTMAAGYAGTVTIATSSISIGAFTQASGTFQGGTGTTTSTGFSVTGGTYNAASTTYFCCGGGTVDVPTTLTFHSLIFYAWFINTGWHWSLGSGDTLVVLGTFTHMEGDIANGTIDARGDLVTQANADGGTTVVQFGNDSLAQTWTAYGGTSLHAQFNSSADASDSIILTANSIFYGVTITGSFSGTIPISQNGYILQVGAGGWSQAAGIFQGTTARTTFDGNFTISGGTYNAASTTYFGGGGGGGTVDVASTQTFESVRFYSWFLTGGWHWTIGSGDTLIMTGTTTLSDGDITNGIINARGDVVVESVFDGGTVQLSFTGSSTSGKVDQTFNLAGGTGTFNSDITINKGEGKVTLLSALVMDAASQDFTVTSGTLDLAGQNLTVSGSGGTFTVASGTTLMLQGGETVTASPTLASGSTIEYSGSGTYTRLVLGASYSNLIFSGSGSWSTSSPMTVTGDFTQTAGTFVHTGTTTFSGAGITITPSAGTLLTHMVVDSRDIPQGLSAWWDFDEGSGSSATDSSGNSKTGTLTNMEAADWSTSDKPTLTYTNEASLGTNANDEYVTVSGNVDIGASWSIASWFKWPLESTASWNTLTRSSVSNHQIIVQRSNNHLGTYVGSFYSSSYDMDALSNGWHHLSAVASSSGTSFFIDGTFVGTAGAKSTDDVYALGNWQGGSQQWGRFDDLRIYSSALSAGEVTDVFDGSDQAVGTTTLAGNLSLSGNLYVVASSTLDVSTSSCNGTSCGVSVGGNFTNSGTYLAQNGTTTFNGTSVQVATGTFSGASSFKNLHITNTSQNGSTTSSVVFGAPISVSDTFTMGASSSVAFLANATSTFEDISLEGASSSPVYLRSGTDGTPYGFSVAGEQKRVTYVNVRDSHACSGNPEISAVDGTSVDAGGNTCWDFPTPGVANIISASNQVFALNSSAAAIAAITVVENPDAPSITSANDLRIAIASSSIPIRFDTTDTTATFGGTASGKVANPVSYEGEGSVLVVDITSDFVAGNTLIISGLSFVNFATVTAPTVALGLRAGGVSDQTDDDTDNKTIAIGGLAVLSNHSSDQVGDNFIFPNAHGVELFVFALSPSGEQATVTDLSFALSDVEGITSTDLGNILLYRDYDGNQEVGVADEVVGGSGGVSISDSSGTITFTGDFLATTTRDYLVIADVANIRPGDAMTMSLSAGSISMEGASSTVAVTVSGSASSIRHFRSGGGAGGEVGDAPPDPGGIRSGGSGGAGQEINPNNGDTIGNDPGFDNPSSTGSSHNEWTSGSGAYDSDGAYATAASTNLRQSYADFSFNIPGNSIIDGIEVKVEAHGSTAAGIVEVALSWDADVSVTSAQASSALTTSDAVYVLGGATETWGRSWTPTELNDTNFRLRLIAQPSGNTISVDALQVKIHQHVGGGGGGGGGEI